MLSGQRAQAWLPFVVFLPLILIIQILTMPRQILGTDSAAIRVISANLVQTGEFGVPFSRKGDIDASLVRVPGQFFIENQAREKLYSRWGEMNTLLYAIPEWFRNADGLHPDEELMMWQNAINICFTLLIMIYLILIAQSLPEGIHLGTGYFCAELYLWHLHLDVSAREEAIKFSAVVFLGYFHHFLSYFRTRRFRHFVTAQVFLLALIHVKTVFIFLYAPSFLLIWMDTKKVPLKFKDAASLGFCAALAVLTIWAVGYAKLGLLP